MLQHTRLLDELSEHVTPEVWAMSARNPQFRPVWESLPVVTNEFPAIRGFKESLNYLRRLNEFTWDYVQRPPSRLSMDRHVRNKNQSRAVRALKFPARVMAALGMGRVFEERLEKALLAYERSSSASKLLEESRPDVIISTGPHRYEEPAIISAAKQLGIPVLAFISSWDNISTKGRFLFKYDGYLLWSERMQQELHDFYSHSRDVPSYIVGASQFDVFFQDRFRQSRAEFCAGQGLRSELPIVVYAVGSPNFISGEYNGALDMARRVDRGELGDVQLLIRPHPIHDNGELAEGLSKLSSRIVLQRTADPGTPLTARSQDDGKILEWVNTFRHADVVVNLSSTVAIDAAIFDRPVVNLDYDPGPGSPKQELVKDVNHSWTHFKPIAESGGLWLADTPAKVVEGIKTYLKHPELHREGRRWIAEFVCGYFDGRCGERMADAIQHFVNNHLEETKRGWRRK
jgi:hypothetical protein